MRTEIPKAEQLEEQVFAISNEKEFSIIALVVYQFQYDNNFLYQDYCNAIDKHPGKVKDVTDIPFLPISFFKTRRIETTSFDPELVFESSGTTGSVPSRHYVKNPGIYVKSFSEGFKRFYGSIKDYCIIGLLPSYLEREQRKQDSLRAAIWAERTGDSSFLRNF